MLNSYLDKMLGITFQAEEQLRAVAPSDVSGLAASRAEQAMTITAYQLYVHRELFEPTLRHGSPAQIAIVRALKVECILLAEEFRAFARVWTMDSVLDQWKAYQPAALELRDRIRAHVDHVKQNAALLSVGHGPRLAGATHF